MVLRNAFEDAEARFPMATTMVPYMVQWRTKLTILLVVILVGQEAFFFGWKRQVRMQVYSALRSVNVGAWITGAVWVLGFSPIG